MTERVTDAWSRIMQWRSECHRRFGSILDLPVRSLEDVLTSLLHPGTRVLDVGAGARTHPRRIPDRSPGQAPRISPRRVDSGVRRNDGQRLREGTNSHGGERHNEA